MRSRDFFPIDRLRRYYWHFFYKMSDNLMAMKVEDTGGFFFSARRTTQNFCVEFLRCSKIINSESKMEWPEFLWRRIVGSTASTHVIIIPVTLTYATTQTITST